jgi:hypothetical protein
MTDENCCPVLRAAAEIQALASAGVAVNAFDPCRPVIIGQLRDRYGCPGPAADNGGLLCPWNWTLNSSGYQLQVRADQVPEIGKPRNPGNFL